MRTPRSGVAALMALAVLTVGTSAACSRDGNPTASPTPAPVATVTRTVTATATAPPAASSRSTTGSSATAAASPTTPPKSGPAESGDSGLELGFVRQVITKEGGKALVWDRATVVGGKVRNPSTRQRLLPLAPDYKVLAGPYLTASAPSGFVTQESFEAAFPSRNPPLIRVRFDDAGQVRIVQEYAVP